MYSLLAVMLLVDFKIFARLNKTANYNMEFATHYSHSSLQRTPSLVYKRVGGLLALCPVVASFLAASYSMGISLYKFCAGLQSFLRKAFFFKYIKICSKGKTEKQ